MCVRVLRGVQDFVIVSVPEKSLVIRKKTLGNGVMKVECLAQGVFPEPSLILRSEER